MELNLFFKVLYRRVRLLLENPDQIKEEWFEFLPTEFDLMALLTGYEENPIKLVDLQKMIEDVVDTDYTSITKVFHAVAAALKIYEIKVEWEESEEASEEESEDDKGKGKGEDGSPDGKDPDDEGFPNSEKMQAMAEAWREYDTGSQGMTLKEALAYSLNTLGRKEWMEEMSKALKKAGVRKVKVTPSDYSNFKISSALKGLIKSKSGM